MISSPIYSIVNIKFNPTESVNFYSLDKTDVDEAKFKMNKINQLTIAINKTHIKNTFHNFFNIQLRPNTISTVFMETIPSKNIDTIKYVLKKDSPNGKGSPDDYIYMDIITDGFINFDSLEGSACGSDLTGDNIEMFLIIKGYETELYSNKLSHYYACKKIEFITQTAQTGPLLLPPTKQTCIRTIINHYNDDKQYNKTYFNDLNEYNGGYNIHTDCVIITNKQRGDQQIMRFIFSQPGIYEIMLLTKNELK